ncbi:MAG: ribosomal-processing cysteine protease Prp [Oscillospiraceae bacterium]|nr:ribosomal-processing cysteine protease Prp [Oscillospiraceae bacterium]
MTKVRFLTQGSLIIGFEITGHSTTDENDQMGRLVCSAVSSAAYMAANTLTEIVGAQVDAKVNDAIMHITVKSKLNESQITLAGLKLHMCELSKQYTTNVKVITEV